MILRNCHPLLALVGGSIKKSNVFGDNVFFGDFFLPRSGGADLRLHDFYRIPGFTQLRTGPSNVLGGRFKLQFASHYTIPRTDHLFPRHDLDLSTESRLPLLDLFLARQICSGSCMIWLMLPCGTCLVCMILRIPRWICAMRILQFFSQRQVRN